MTHQVEFFYDIVSPYSYLAAVQLEELAQQTDSEILWQPMFLPGLFKLIGNQPPQTLPERKHYLFEQDLPRMARFLQVPYNKPESFPSNTVYLMRALMSIKDNRQRMEKSLALYELYWGEGQDVATDQVILSVLGEEALEFAKSDQGKAVLMDNTQRAADKGAFGAPTLFVGDEMFFGCDRIPQLKHHLQRL
ncbi:2-hydroxychromene-2-carboxylate isomerase [Oceanospirillum maris]|jgi:2-hydroxychromene-2-carboxylate isomerase|uniref:2-hydroxychromene-2-carboxylate isomerase n=1 Tax=Oceanospirillum maris TaxID=64977 RepID=UPI000407EBCF|nr:2-hydroxychromene-2-carboxylate isomerase [Oceanospirillum maris]